MEIHRSLESYSHDKHVFRHYAGFRTIPGGQVFVLIGGVLMNIFPA